MTVELVGWLLDLYADPQGDIALWLLAEDGQRLRLRQAFPVTFYAAGEPEQLRQLWRFLQQQPTPVTLSRQRRRDLFQAEPLPVLACQVAHPAAQTRLFYEVSQRFPELTYYDADINLTLRHAARYGTFPLARCRVQADEAGRVCALEVLDSPWELDPLLPALRAYETETARPQLRIWDMSPEGEPNRSQPAALRIRFELAGDRIRRFDFRLPLDDLRQAIQTLNWWLKRYDPDLILTDWGDTWMLPMLIEAAAQFGLPLNLSRDPARTTAYRDERSYFSYGRIVYRGGQVTLFGRWHIDRHNAMMWSDYALDGVLENARVTALPVQEAARLSPGTGISAMQIRNALEHDILVPWRKQQVEQEKSALDLIHADMGGLVYQPVTGVHGSVGALDFISMYPSIMVRGSISPETVDHDPLVAPPDPEGLIPRTLAPLLEKRISLKTRQSGRGLNVRRQSDKARSSALKWLLVVCFGYLGFKNARFGRIEAHEAVTRYGREALLRAKDAAEDLGFEVLHMYVDALWLRKPGAEQPEDFEPVLLEIARRTGLPISIDGVYRWVAFLPSCVDPRVPVPNRYFGAFQDGSIKVRGLMCRRSDVPAWVSQLQMEMIAEFAKAEGVAQLPDHLPAARRCLERRLADLRAGRVPLEDLLVSQRLSRELDRYRTPSPAARAAQQLAAAGRSVRPGQRVRFLHLLGQPDVHAWDLPTPVDPRRIDRARYQELARRAAEEVLGGLQLIETPTLFGTTRTGGLQIC